MMKGRPQAAAREDLSMTILRSPRDLLGLYDTVVGYQEAPDCSNHKVSQIF